MTPKRHSTGGTVEVIPHVHISFVVSEGQSNQARHRWGVCPLRLKSDVLRGLFSLLYLPYSFGTLDLCKETVMRLIGWQ